jgi:hypothetical protein
MAVGAHEEDCSAVTNHRSIENVWYKHFDRLSGHPIEIVWAWAPSERIVALEPTTKCVAVQLLLDKCNPHTNCMVISEQKSHSLSQSIGSINLALRGTVVVVEAVLAS